MPKYTLLDMTQKILASMSSDEVNSIGDTIEAGQVAEVIRQTYYDLVDEHNLPSNSTLFSLEASNVDQPSRMHIPDFVSKLEWIKYNIKETVGEADRYVEIQYLSPKDFMQVVNGRASTDSTVKQCIYNANIYLNILNNVAPRYWTSFDDEYVWFDAFNFSIETNLQESKVQCYGEVRIPLLMEDQAIPTLPENLFGYLLAKSKASCFAVYKQEANPKLEQTERRMRIRVQRNKWKEDIMEYERPNYGKP
jgi:hypothetical protein